MGQSKCFLFTLCLALLFAAAVSSKARADEWDHATKLTFSEPVEIPGRFLDAGTYWFTLADSQSDRNIVQIWNADRTELVTTVLAIPDYRLLPTGDTVINRRTPVRVARGNSCLVLSGRQFRPGVRVSQNQSHGIGKTGESARVICTGRQPTGAVEASYREGR